jgi:hypothetical protein
MDKGCKEAHRRSPGALPKVQLLPPDQHGSASIKAVLPVLAGMSYDDLEIHEGGQASLEFLRVHFDHVSDAERRQVRRSLERYCGQDTMAMLWLVDELRRMCR